MNDISQKLEDRKYENTLLVRWAAVCIALGVGCIVYFVVKVSESHSLPGDGQTLNFEHWGAFGDFVAGVAGTLFTLGGFFLLYLTLKDQRENFHKERLESNFFEMVRFHRDNVDELQFSYYEAPDRKVMAEKRKVFKLIFVHFKEAWGELELFFAENNEKAIYAEDYLREIKNAPSFKERRLDLVQLARIDIVYLIIFFGLSFEDRQTITRMLVRKYDKKLVADILEYASLKPKREYPYWNRWKRINDSSSRVEDLKAILAARKGLAAEDPRTFYPDNYEKYYGGHQFRLGHYYRHMYAAVNFIDREETLTLGEKYFYVKILRVQLSNYEQICLFLNSVSSLGRAWELNGDKKLISTYGLITNIPMPALLGEINLIDYYPEVKFADYLV